jgi:hypothetical protein
MAGIVAAALAGLVLISAGVAAVMLLVFDDIVAFVNFALAVRTGAFGVGSVTHSANT